jgi:uncharacterized protein (TIGR00369 family)
MARINPPDFGLKNYRFRDRFGEWLGYRVTRTDRKRRVAEVRLTIREDHLSPAGRVHGGVVSAFFDFACGAAVFTTMSPHDFCSTVELKVNYLKPIDLGDKMRALSRVVFRGKKLCVVHAFLYCSGNKQPVAMATATFNVVVVSDGASAPKRKRKA